MAPREKLIYKFTVRIAIYTLSAGAVLIGAGLIAGGQPRFVAPSLATARLMPAAPYVWGILIAAGGALSITAAATGWRRRFVMAGLACQGCWFLFFDISLWITVAQDNTTPFTGPVAYLMLAAVHAVLYVGSHGLASQKGPQ